MFETCILVILIFFRISVFFFSKLNIINMGETKTFAIFGSKDEIWIDRVDCSKTSLEELFLLFQV